MTEPWKLSDIMASRDAAPEAAWKKASPEERREALDDLLMDTLLAETLGGKSVALCRTRWVYFASAAAALVVVAVMLWWLAAGRQAGQTAQLSGDFTVVSKSGQPVKAHVLSRGDTVEAGTSGARVSLKGRFDLALSPGTRLTWLGEDKKELIDIARGRVTSKVERHKGQFTVRTPRGDVTVLGTEFVTSVEYLGETEGDEMDMNALKKTAVVTVMVLSGAVAYQFDGQSGQLNAGMSGTFAEPVATPTPDSTFLAANAPAQPAVDTPASKITLDVKDADLDDILAQFARQSGNSAVCAPEKWNGETVTFSVKDLPYWEALDKLCETAGRLYYSAEWTPGDKGFLSPSAMRLARAKGGHEIGACSGPVSVKLVNGTEEITLRGPLQGIGLTAPYKDIPGDGDFLTRVNYRFEYYWEDRLGVVANDARITKALGPKGKEIRILDSQRGWERIDWRAGVKPFTGSLAATLDLPNDVQKIDEIDGVVRLVCGKGEKALKIDDVVNAAGKSVKDGDLTLTVTQAKDQDGCVSVAVKLKKGDQEIEVPAYQRDKVYGFTLEGPNGAKRTGMRTVSADVVKMLRAQGISVGPLAWDGGPGTFVTLKGTVEPAPGETAVAFQAARGLDPFTGEKAKDSPNGPWTLVYTYPGDGVVKEFPFKLTDVPLP